MSDSVEGIGIEERGGLPSGPKAVEEVDDRLLVGKAGPK